MIRGKLDEIRSLRSKICYGGCTAMVLPALVGIEVPLSMEFKAFTASLALIITAGLLLTTRGINGDFTPDIPLTDFTQKLKRHKQEHC